MKNVKISINRTITEEVYNDNTTINEILLDHGTTGECCIVYIGADRVEDKNATLAEVSGDAQIRMTVVENKANAAVEVKRLGNTLVFGLGYKLDEVLEVKQNFPMALRHIDEKGNTLFALDTADAFKGSVSGFGIELDAIPAPDGEAICTVDYYGENDDIVDGFYRTINELNVIAEQIGATLGNIAVAKETARRSVKF